MTNRSDRTALLLVDLQRDFLDRPGLVPDAGFVCRQAAQLLSAARARGMPVAHTHTITTPDGVDSMPHWKAGGVVACVEGTDGAAPPDPLVPGPGELVVHKQFYTAFCDPTLDAWLRARSVARVIVAGVYTHGCVRATVLDAYQRGYEVLVAADAVGTTDPVHGEQSTRWLDGRAARFLLVDDLLRDIGDSPQVAARVPASCLPVAVIGGEELPASTHRRRPHRDPSRSDTVIAEVPLGGTNEVKAAAVAAAEAQPAWAKSGVAERVALLDRWADALARDAPRLASLIVDEVGKPRRAAEDEVERAVAHVHTASRVLELVGVSLDVAAGVTVRRRPVGVVGLVMPWNNPAALPVGKLAPAIAFGNAAILKPAPEASRVGLALLDSLSEVGAPAGLVGAVLGDREAAEALCDNPLVDAISVTGSVATGRALAARCARTTKSLQAELGGNNAAIILRDADVEQIVLPLLRGAFAFAGQRCTAIRRFVVEAALADRFEAVAKDVLPNITVGDPQDPATEIGPMISLEARDRVLADIERARADGARVVTGGMVPGDLAGGAWLAPTLLAGVDPASGIAQEETFGPVAVLIVVGDLEEAIWVANGVVQGLVMAVCTNDEHARARVLDEARAGIAQVGPGPLAVHPDAPFGGWKASGLGPPEHGEWDAAFYTRPQAVYGDVAQ